MSWDLGNEFQSGQHLILCVWHTGSSTLKLLQYVYVLSLDKFEISIPSYSKSSSKKIIIIKNLSLSRISKPVQASKYREYSR